VDDSDDDIGPKPVPGAVHEERSAVQEFLEREQRWAREREEAAKPKVPKREEWMLVPPTSGILSSVDPLRKRPTTFNRTNKEVKVDTSIWTETPEEKARRLADEIAGIKRREEPSRGTVEEGLEGKSKRKRDEEVRREVERHNKSARNESLLEQHLKKGPAEDDKKGIWDHDRDMGITGRLLSDQERQAKIKEARGLNDRFGHGKSGAFNM